eukprot:gene8419-11386_t
MVKYFTALEVSVHCNPEDCWVSIFDNVYDITGLILANRGVLANPLIEAGGTSITHWFNEKTGEVKTYIDPVRNIKMYYTPYGRFIHVPPEDPMDKVEAIALPWWRDPKYIIGKLTKKTMLVRITNMLTRTEDTIRICQEETVGDIRNRYMEHNLNSNSYTWKALINGDFILLKSEFTLAENGIVDETEKLARLGMDEDFSIPNIHIYYNDDLNYA